MVFVYFGEESLLEMIIGLDKLREEKFLIYIIDFISNFLMGKLIILRLLNIVKMILKFFFFCCDKMIRMFLNMDLV